MRNNDAELIGINNTLASSVEIMFEEQQIKDIYYYNQVDGDLTPEDEFPFNARKLQGFNWRGEERILSKEGLFDGEEEPELTEIEGISLPEEPEEFFEEREKDDLLLDKNSRLNPKVLKNRKTDSLKYKKKVSPDSIKKKIPEVDTLKTDTNQDR
ncbi:MAG: OstA-like protein, partial [Gramella sp.]|nr:OstA-like protein [Christiangramia sp.]